MVLGLRADGISGCGGGQSNGPSSLFLIKPQGFLALFSKSGIVCIDGVEWNGLPTERDDSAWV